MTMKNKTTRPSRSDDASASSRLHRRLSKQLAPRRHVGATLLTYDRLLSYALRILSRKDYSVATMKMKLQRKGTFLKLPGVDAASRRVVERLHELNYLNDARVIKNALEYRLAEKPCGKNAFIFNLYRQGIPKVAARQAWDEAGVDEEALARDLLKRKARRFATLSREVRARKYAQLLSQRGFASSTIWSLLENLPE